MLVIGLTTIICGGEGFEEMEELGHLREAWFKEFLELPHGIPDEDTFRRLFERLNPLEVLKCLQAWLQEAGESGNREVNIDGKTMCGSRKAGEHKAVHVVSAWVGTHNLVLGQVATEEKSNEITAIPELLDMIDIQGDIVTIDAMGCQTDIAEKIRKKNGEYILAVKENQPTLYKNIEEYFHWLEQEQPPDEVYGYWKSGLEIDHGRLERREITAVTHIDWLETKKAWKDVKTIIKYRCWRTVDSETTEHDRYYISSLEADAERFGQLIREHWSIENRLHWCLDVTFREDAGRARKDNAPMNLNILRKLALVRLRLVETDKKRLSIRRKMLKATVSSEYLHTVLFGK
jgi:predicted transposase YbfD/YdcC